MPGVIKILPESLVNKIAAGEVVERPASVVKELVENSIDAKAKNIIVNVQDGGKTMIQVIDDGVGMNETDARLAFERHATSKIATVDDLFNIKTKGFRGEALASIASVSKVELKTRREEDKIGTRVVIEGGKFKLQEPINCPKGANFIVRDLFYNIPARRKFLKSDTTEFKHIINEFLRQAIPHPNIAFELYHNNRLIYKVPKSTLKERIVNLFDKSFSKILLPINYDADFVKIYGYISTPEAARKKNADQFFFVNNRFFRSQFLHRAVMKAIEKLIPPEHKPIYFIFFQIDPSRIDVNIHPQKIEVNFQDSENIFHMLTAAVKNALAKNGFIPSIDFDTADTFDTLQENITFEYNLSFYDEQNEQDNTTQQIQTIPSKISSNTEKTKQKSYDWEKLYQILDQKIDTDDDNYQNDDFNSLYLNYQGKYIITSLKSGLAIIHQTRAFETIFYNEILQNLTNNSSTSQATIYPISLELNPKQLLTFELLKPKFEKIGYSFQPVTENKYNIVGIPPFIKLENAKQIILDVLQDPDAEHINIQQASLENVALLLARAKARQYNYKLSHKEMENLINKLFSTENPNYSPSGKKVIHLLKSEEIDKFFK